jgi:single-stranded-DNA-specific exonuclease
MPPTVATPPPRWSLRAADPVALETLMRTQRISRVAAALLLARGIVDPEAAALHLEPKLTRLHDPSALPGMKAATQRIARAIESGETILVHGDYDVDGVTGTALLMRLFELVGAHAVWHIPNRFTDGYSFGPHSIEKARATGATLVISVDNGTSALETITALRAIGVDTIVTDHHEPPHGELPPAVAIVNPKVGGHAYPFRELCGGAVAFKLAWGVCQELSGASRVREELRRFLVDAMGYVAIATVCDVVPLVDENRILAHFGLRSLESSTTPGILAMLEVAGLRGRKLLAEDVAFKIGPRINASGRLGSAQKAVELLLARDAESARSLALELDGLNDERRSIEVALLQHAIRACEPFADREQHPVLVVAGQGWHQGVVGIIAARLASRFERPAIVIGLDGASGRGSARSVPGFSVLDVLDGAAAHLVKHGGHEQAAGCEVEASRIDALREAVCARAREVLGDGGFPAREVHIDHALPFAQVTVDLMKEVERLQPFGERNEKPLLMSSDVRLAEPARALGADGTHLMVKLRSGDHVLKAMAFGQARRMSELSMGVPIDIVFTPKWNTFRGETNLELELHDFRRRS